MNKNFYLLLVLLLGGCASGWNTNAAIFNQGGEVKRNLYKKIKIGMTENEVRLNWGEPEQIVSKNVNGSDKVWIYKPHWKFKNLLYFKNGILIGGDPNPENIF